MRAAVELRNRMQRIALLLQNKNIIMLTKFKTTVITPLLLFAVFPQFVGTLWDRQLRLHFNLHRNLVQSGTVNFEQQKYKLKFNINYVTLMINYHYTTNNNLMKG